MIRQEEHPGANDRAEQRSLPVPTPQQQINRVLRQFAENRPQSGRLLVRGEIIAFRMWRLRHLIYFRATGLKATDLRATALQAISLWIIAARASSLSGCGMA